MGTFLMCKCTHVSCRISICYTSIIILVKNIKTAAMVKWSDSWLEKVDANNVKLKLWVIIKDIQYAKCSLCSSDIKFDKQGFEAFIQIQNVLTIRIYQALDLIQEMPKSKQHSCQQLLLIINKSNKS